MFGAGKSARAHVAGVSVGAWVAIATALGLSFLFFFFVLTSYYLLRPLRDQFSAAVGSTNLWPFWLATLVGLVGSLVTLGRQQV